MMPKLDRKTHEKLAGHIDSLVKFYQELHGDRMEISESLISWLQLDVQGLKLVASEMELQYYEQIVEELDA
jgi:hypothetical protein